MPHRRFLLAIIVLVSSSMALEATAAESNSRLLLLVSRRSALTDIETSDLKKVVLGERVVSGREVWIATPPKDGGELASLARELLGLSNEQLEIERAGRTESTSGTGVRLFENTNAVLSAVRSFPNVIGIVRLDPSKVDDSLVVVWKSARP